MTQRRQRTSHPNMWRVPLRSYARLPSHRPLGRARRATGRRARRLLTKTATISGCDIGVLPMDARLTEYRRAFAHIVLEARSPTLDAARDELVTGLGGLLGATPAVDTRVTARRFDRARHAGHVADRRVAGSRDTRSRSAGDDGFVLRATTVGGKHAIVVAANRDVGVLYGAFALLRVVQTLQSVASLDIVERAADQAAHARPLGQPRPQRRARLRGQVALGLGDAAGLAPAALPRLRARERVDRHQRRVAQERQRERADSHARVSRQGRGARRRVPPVRHPRLSDGALQRADRDRRPQDRRSARPGRARSGGRRRRTRSTSTFPTSAASS